MSQNVPFVPNVPFLMSHPFFEPSEQDHLPDFNNLHAEMSAFRLFEAIISGTKCPQMSQFVRRPMIIKSSLSIQRPVRNQNFISVALSRILFHCSPLLLARLLRSDSADSLPRARSFLIVNSNIHYLFTLVKKKIPLPFFPKRSRG